MDTWVISDMHLGARQCRARWLRAFLANVPSDVRLILNGDVITRTRGADSLSADHAAALDDLRALSLRQEVIWIGGNHDRRVRVDGEHAFRFCGEYAIDKNLFIAHGDQFDHLSCTLRFVLLPLRIMYEFLTRVIGSQTHVADFAKRFPWVYEILNGHVVRNATAYARTQGYAAVACGHTHHPGMRQDNGVTYYNTGCWTENSAYVLVAKDGGTLQLRSVDQDGSLSG